MKLLIDIPEHIYEHAKEMTEDSRDEGEAMRAIANGSPARCMDEAEKERLIKKNMLSIENRVRNAFNQGYEMGVKESRSEIPNKWIPVSERLPEDRTYVLTTIKVPNRIAHARSGWYDGGFFHNDNGDTWKATDREVIAWMPLPEPYKAESEE